MEEFYCETHSTNVKRYAFGEEGQFIDDNKAEIVIFTLAGGARLLKRFMAEGCNDSCLFIQSLLEPEE